MNKYQAKKLAIEELIPNDKHIDPKIKQSILELLKEFPSEENARIEAQILSKDEAKNNYVLAQANIKTQYEELQERLENYPRINYVTIGSLVALILSNFIAWPAVILCFIVVVICNIKDYLKFKKFTKGVNTETTKFNKQSTSITESIEKLDCEIEKIKNIQDPKLDAWEKALDKLLEPICHSRPFFQQNLSLRISNIEMLEPVKNNTSQLML
jgi:hypothetical protein